MGRVVELIEIRKKGREKGLSDLLVMVFFVQGPSGTV